MKYRETPPFDVSSGTLPRLLQNLGMPARLNTFRNGHVISEQSLVDHYHLLLSGAAKEFGPDGRDQIFDILLPGDFIDVLPPTNGSAVETISDNTIVAYYPRRNVDALAASNLALTRELHATSLITLARWRNHLLMLGQPTALGKVSSFLLEMRRRLTADDLGVFDLPVCRYDIAQYLAISSETVSRSITRLKDKGVIRLLGSHRLSISQPDTLVTARSREIGEPMRRQDSGSFLVVPSGSNS